MKTFHEWSRKGYKINKGAKGTKVGKEFYFSEQQVTYSPRRIFNATFDDCDFQSRGSVYSYADYDDGLFEDKNW